MGADYVEHANREILLLPMIETAQAMANLDDILSTPGLDGCYIGPADLSLSHGYKPGMDREEEDIVGMINQIRNVAHKNGLAAGIHCGSPEYALSHGGIRIPDGHYPGRSPPTASGRRASCSADSQRGKGRTLGRF